MTIYQADYKNIHLRDSADLVISSIPLNILRDDQELGHLHQWLTDCALGALIIVDLPEKFGKVPFGLPDHSETLNDFYKEGKAQNLFFYFNNQDFQLPSFGYKECYNRHMSHPCEFDETMIIHLIEQYSKKNDVILDMFCGSGTVPRVAHQLERNGIGIDLRCPYTNKL